MHLRDARFPLVPEEFRMDIVTLILGRLVHFHLDAMGVGPSILTDAGHLPGDFHSRLTGLDGEAAIGYFRRDPGLGGLANRGELIAEVRVEGFEPRGHGDDGRAAAVGNDVAVVRCSSCREIRRKSGKDTYWRGREDDRS